jgi:hypothetical protein
MAIEARKTFLEVVPMREASQRRTVGGCAGYQLVR